jgi:hypothetical protein
MAGIKSACDRLLHSEELFTRVTDSTPAWQGRRCLRLGLMVNADSMLVRNPASLGIENQRTKCVKMFRSNCIDFGPTTTMYYAYSSIKAPDKGEVGGSSPPRPTIQITNKYEAILTFPLSGNLYHKPICQLFANFSGNQRPPPSGARRGAAAVITSQGVSFIARNDAATRIERQKRGWATLS